MEPLGEMGQRVQMFLELALRHEEPGLERRRCAPIRSSTTGNQAGRP